MARELPLYDGVQRKAAQVQVVDGVRLPRVQGMGEVFDRAVDAGMVAARGYAEWNDFGVRQRVEHALRQNQDAMDVEFKRGMEAKWGSEGSFYRADGSRDEDALAAFKERWRERNEGIGRSFLLRENAMADWARISEVNDTMARRVDMSVLEGESANRRQFFKDNFDLAVKQEDWQDAMRGVDEAVALGIISPARGEVMKLDVGRCRLRSVAASAGYGYPASVNVGGEEFSGLSAALAMEDARGKGHGARREVQGTRVEVQGEMGAEAGQGGTSGSAPADLRRDGKVPRSEGDERALTLMPEDEFGEVSDSFSFDARVLTMPGVDGSALVSCAAQAPVCVQRVAAVGNARGGVDEQQARMMVARISLDMVAENPGVTDAQVAGVFDKAGIYEALGNGDAAVGEQRARAIAAECLERGRGDSKKLGMGAIEPMIQAHLNSPGFADSREWGRVAGLNPRLEKGVEWDKSDLDEAGRKRWFALYDVYRKYRREFKSDAKGELDKDEFEENAQAFHAWYMKEKYKALKEADVAAAQDWYLMRTASDLRAKVYAGADGGTEYAGYGHDVQVAREVLREMPPESLGADELVAASVASQKQDSLRSEAFRQAARADYERLRELKQAVAENDDKAKKERERKAKAEERKEERAAREAEKKAERDAARKLFVARSTPREAVWVWDGKNAGDGAMPQCRVPEDEYKRLQDELGFDGSQLVYVQVNGARVLVTGVSRSGKLELNAPAVAKVQKKPNARKGERWKTSGNLGFSYYFKSTEAK